jgi:hypothetical protein
MITRKNGKEDIPNEALWMDFLSRRTMYIPNLRQLTAFRGKVKRWRYYMEFCPHGMVSDLVKVYKDFNKSHSRSEA